MSRPPLRVANLMGPQVGAFLRSHPAKPNVLDLPHDAIGALPDDRNAIFTLYRGEAATPLRPATWPGNVAWIQIASAGVDEYPSWLLEAPLVTSARGTTHHAIAEFAIAVMLAREKQIPGVFVTSANDWPAGDDRVSLALGSLRGKTLGLIGAGTIGSTVAELALVFGMHVVAARRSTQPMPDARMTSASLDDTLAAADHLVIAAPLTDATRGMFDDARFARLKRGAHFVNVARGPIVDQEALLRALDRDPALHATLDVTEPEPLPNGHPLYAHPRVRVSPHRSFSSPRTLTNVLELFAENISHYEAGEPMRNVVDRARGY